MPAQTVIKIRRDTSTNWSSVNPTLAAGEIAFETDTNKIKVGDGSTAWASLDYASGAGTAAEITYDNVDAELIATTVKGALDELSNNKVDPADLTAVNTSADTTNFTGNLSSSDTTVQAALDTLDDLEISAGVTTSDTPPSSPSNGDLWWESDTGILYIYYDNFWVEAVSGIVGPQGESGAVISDTEPADQDVLWVDTSSSATAESTLNNGTEGLTAVSNGTAGLSYQPVSHNYIINGAFDIWQRGTSFTFPQSDSFTADRWRVVSSANRAKVISREQLTLAEQEQTGARYFLRYDTTGETAFDNRLSYRIEGLELAGKEVTLSFYARTSATSAFLELDVRSVNASSQNVLEDIAIGTADSTLQRYSVTFTVPSAPAGTQDDSSLVLLLLDFEDKEQVFDITGVQLEAGSIATPFKRNANSIQGELAACQRYYLRLTDENSYSLTNATFFTADEALGVLRFPVEMRTSPSLSADPSGTFQVISSGAGFSVSSIIGTLGRSNSIQVTYATTTNATQGHGALLRITSGYIEFTGAEL